MRYDPDRHHRRSIRLWGWDYSQPAAYFVTLCTQGGECLFGEVLDGAMRPNESGEVVIECWAWLSHRYRHVALDAWVVMPNHFHGILTLTDDDGFSGRGGSRTAPTMTDASAGMRERTHAVKRKALGNLIAAFKTVSTKRINDIRGTPGGRVWQRNYYERIIRNERELYAVREYVRANPRHWAEDEENPARR